MGGRHLLEPDAIQEQQQVLMHSIRTDRHIWDVPPDLYVDSALMAWLGQFAFVVSTCATKVSVLLFYRRLVKGTYSAKWKWATIAAIGFTVAYCIAFVLALVFNCSPTEAYWKSMSLTYTKNYRCVNTTVVNPVSGALSVVSDLYSVVLPMGMLYSIEIERRKRIALYAVFSLGLLVVAAGSVRTYYLAQLGHSYDVTWVGFDTLIWADLEVQLAIICASAPVLRVLFRQMRPTLSRAVMSASAGRSSKRDSMPRVQSPVSSVTYVGDRNSQSVHNATPALEVLKECELEVAYSHTPTRSYEVKNAAEFEAYALQSLDRHRSARRWQGPPRHASFASRRPSETMVESKAVPMSWLDDRP